jgi:transketolase
LRSTFIKTLAELAGENENIVFLTGDLGFMVVEPFTKKYPERFYNVGVAEQNMVGIATGLAEAGYIPFVYSIAGFAALRPYEFIRNGPIYHNLPVRVIGVGSGFDYGINGLTHYGIDDLGVMRIQPDMRIFCPADYNQTANLLRETWDSPGPVYYKLGKDNKLEVPGLNGEFRAGRLQVVQEGESVCLLGLGSTAIETSQAADELQSHGIKCSVAVVASINPEPVEDLIDLLSTHEHAVTIEAHYINGGLGSLVAEVIADNGLTCRLSRIGIRKTPVGELGSQKFMSKEYGLSPDAIVRTVMDKVDE